MKQTWSYKTRLFNFWKKRRIILILCYKLMYCFIIQYFLHVVFDIFEQRTNFLLMKPIFICNNYWGVSTSDKKARLTGGRAINFQKAILFNFLSFSADFLAGFLHLIVWRAFRRQPSNETFAQTLTDLLTLLNQVNCILLFPAYITSAWWRQIWN